MKSVSHKKRRQRYCLQPLPFPICRIITQQQVIPMRLNPIPLVVILIIGIVGYAIYNFAFNNPFSGN